jgi:iron complex outermembrane receptor protein
MTMPRNSGQVSQAVRLALLASSVPVMTMSQFAFAQDADDEEQVQELEEVTVTGSRIPSRNLISSSPVTTVNADEIHFQGVTRIEDLLNSLPQVSPTQQSGVANGATGTATVDLRGLTAERTLVLVNGRRMPAGNPAAGGIATDLNSIPAAMIDRVEVLTGGASAAYGSDAIAGVVNFITKTDFEGVSFDYQYSGYQHKNDNAEQQAINTAAGFTLPEEDVTDGYGRDYNLVVGINSGDGRGNVTAYATYRDIEPILEGSRDYSNCALAGSAGSFSCGGSSTLPEGRFTDFGALTGVGPGSFDYIVSGDQFVPRAGLLYNYAPSNYYQRPDERIIAGAIGNYQFSDSLEVFAEMSFMDDKTVAQIAPSGAFFVTTSLPCGNPLLSAQQFQLLCGDFGLTTADTQTVFIGRRNVEGGNRQDTLRHTSNRVVAGARGDINDAWSYEAYANFGTSAFSQTYLNDLSTTNILRALNVVADTRPATLGQPVCASVLDGSDPSCLPWDVFTEGALPFDRNSPIQQYLATPLYATGEVTTTVVNGYVVGDMGNYGWQLPGADTGISIVGGFEQRQERLIFTPDKNFQSGDGAGQGGPVKGTEGGFDVNEFFFEAAVPLYEGGDFADSVNLSLGYRYSDYDTNQQTDTFKGAFDWAFNDSFRLRASFQRAVRAGNIRELFRPQAIGLFDMVADPCGGPTPAATLAQCQNTGVTAARYGTIANSPAGQYNFIGGGNPDLQPETSDTVSFGFIVSPGAVEGLIVSADYYKIDVEDAISAVDPSIILNECLETGAAIFCDAIHRGATTQTLWIGQDNITSTDINIGSLTREGVDLQAAYGFDVGNMGSLDLSLVGSYAIAADEVPIPGGSTIECVGTWDTNQCLLPFPEWAHTFRTTWETPWDMSLSLNWRHIGETTDNAGLTNFDSFDWFDLSGTWQATESIQLRLGVSNVFDEEPPVAVVGAGFGNGNTYPGVYDARGRYFFAGFSVRL